MSDRKVTFLPWEEENIDYLDQITRCSGMPSNAAGISGYIQKFFILKGAGRRMEGLQVCVGHLAIMEDMKQGMFGWTQEKGHDVFVNIL